MYSFRTILFLVQVSVIFSIPSITNNLTAYFSIHGDQTAQVILGIGFEIQSDSIGSGNHGLPDVNTSVPWDLVPTERQRFYSSMLYGFRYCRLALGLYFRGLTNNNQNIVERWPGQAAVLAEMATEAKLEGFAVEYWSPPPGWKSTNSYIDGTLVSFDDSTLSAFGAAVTEDALYLESQNISVVWWGLQNEPPVGPSGCIYSCCGYNSEQYYQAFNYSAPLIRAALPNASIHVSSWSGPYYSPQLSNDPNTLQYVDIWTYHYVGADSDVMIQKQNYLNNFTHNRPVLNNEFEYLDDQTSAERTINTAQSIMNWMVFENSPTWYWLHALKPLINAEADGYSLGFWNPIINSSTKTTLPPGYWDYNYDNYNAIAGFIKYLPWDSVRINVTEDEVRYDVRIMAYLYNPQKAIWLLEKEGKQREVEKGSTRKVMDGNDHDLRAAATKLGFVVTNRMNSTVTNMNIQLEGISNIGNMQFHGHLYTGNITDQDLGIQIPILNTTNQQYYLPLVVEPYSIQFWVQE